MKTRSRASASEHRAGASAGIYSRARPTASTRSRLFFALLGGACDETSSKDPGTDDPPDGLADEPSRVDFNAPDNTADEPLAPSHRKRIVRFVEELRRRSGGSAKMSVELTSRRPFPGILSQTSSESNFSSSTSNEGADLCLNFAAPSIVHSSACLGARMIDDVHASSSGGDNYAPTTSEPASGDGSNGVGRGERAGSALTGLPTTATPSRSNSNATRSVSVNDGRLQRFAPLLAGGSSVCSVETSAKLAHASLAARYRCLFGSCHVVAGTKLFLVFYICLTICGILCGMVSALVWTLVPLFIIPMSLHAFWAAKPKYLYPLLIITVVHMIVCLLMAFIVTVFALYNYDKLSLIVAQNLRGGYYFIAETPSGRTRGSGHVAAKQERSALSLASTPYGGALSSTRAALAPVAASPASTSATVLRHHFDYGTLTVLLVGVTVVTCLLLSIFFAWQTIVISSCIEYYDFWAFHADEPPSTLSRASDRLLLTATHAEFSSGKTPRNQRLNSSMKRGSSGSTAHISMPTTPFCAMAGAHHLNAPITVNGGATSRESRILAVTRSLERDARTAIGASQLAHEEVGLRTSINSAPGDARKRDSAGRISPPPDSGESLATRSNATALSTAKLSDATISTWIPSTTSDGSLTLTHGATSVMNQIIV